MSEREREPVKKMTVDPATAAAMLDIHKNTLLDLIKHGKLRASKLSPRIIRIRVSDIEAMLTERVA